MSTPHHETLLIIDFGSQVTQLIARRVRECGVYCEIHPFTKATEKLAALQPKAVILSGSPHSVIDAGPRIDAGLFEMGVPFFGICYGEQLMCELLGGKVESGHDREFGRAEITVKGSSPIFKGLDAVETVWMSHGDRVTRLPQGFTVLDAQGQWRAADGGVVRERSHLLQVVHPDDGSADAPLAQIIARYKAQFEQESVLQVRSAVCLGF